MDEKLRYYAVMKTVERAHGKRGKTFLVKLLKGSGEYSVEKAVQEFDLVPFWGLLFRLDREEIESLLAEQVAEGRVFIEEVSTGGYTFPFLHISDKGREALASLEKTEEIKLITYLEQACFEQKSPEVSNKGMLLDKFLLHLFQLLEFRQNHASLDMDLTALSEHLDFDFSTAEMIEKFLYRSTPDKLKEQFRSPYVLDIVCFELASQVRRLLAGFPEQEAMMFRCRYNIKDSIYQPLIGVMKHYRLMERDVQYTIKRYISHFANRGYMDKYPFVNSVASLLAECFGEGEGDSVSLVRETSQVTYEMYQSGMSIPEIARERGLAVSTIFAHFARLIPKYNMNIDEILPRERISGILQAADTTGGISLKAIREQLPPDYNYGEIKLVMELERGWKAA